MKSSLLLTSMGGKIYTLLASHCQNKVSQDLLRNPSITALQRFCAVILQVAECIHYTKASTEVRPSIEKEMLLKTHIEQLLTLVFSPWFAFSEFLQKIV